MYGIKNVEAARYVGHRTAGHKGTHAKTLKFRFRQFPSAECLHAQLIAVSVEADWATFGQLRNHLSYTLVPKSLLCHANFEYSNTTTEIMT
jgi:hypothetical protein